MSARDPDPFDSIEDDEQPMSEREYPEEKSSWGMDGIRYPKPLSLNDKALIALVTERFEGLEAPFIAFDRGDHIELKHAKTIRISAKRFKAIGGKEHKPLPLESQQ